MNARSAASNSRHAGRRETDKTEKRDGPPYTKKKSRRNLGVDQHFLLI